MAASALLCCGRGWGGGPQETADSSEYERTDIYLLSRDLFYIEKDFSDREKDLFDSCPTRTEAYLEEQE